MRVLRWPLKITNNWRIALALTCAFWIVGLFCIAILLIYPPSIVPAPCWRIVDRRWLLALYGLGVGLVYFPLIAKKIANLLTRSEVPATTDSGARSHPSRFRAVRYATAIVLAFAISIVLLAPPPKGVSYGVGGLEKPLNLHEMMHLGPIQRIDNDATPYVEAQTQYGPGHQFVSYYLMRFTEFSMVGFRASHVILNMAAEGIRFSLFVV